MVPARGHAYHQVSVLYTWYVPSVKTQQQTQHIHGQRKPPPQEEQPGGRGMLLAIKHANPALSTAQQALPHFGIKHRPAHKKVPRN